MAKPRALITGITGMVGSHLAEYLLAHTDWDIDGMCRWRSPLDNIRSLVPTINRRDRVPLVYGDLRDTLSIQEVVRQARPDYVFHLAAQSFPRTSFDAPLDTLDTNVQGTARVLEALRTYRTDAIIHVCSSSEVFGRVPKDKLPIDEECTFHPASPYAISKVGTDLLGRFYAEAYGMTVMTTRMFTHTGPRRGDVFAESTFAKQIAMIEAGLIAPVVKVGNLEVAAHDRRRARRGARLPPAGDRQSDAGAYYNIGGTYTCTVGEILDALVALSPRERHPYRGRSGPFAADRRRSAGARYVEVQRIPAGIRRSRSSRRMVDLLGYWRDRVKQDGNSFLTR